MSIFSADRLRQAIEVVVRALVPPVDALAFYEGTITAWDYGAQSGIVAFTHPALPPTIAGVPLRISPPGTRVDVAAGSTALIAFVGADLARPEIRALGTATGGGYQPIRLDLAEGTAAAAREGDSVALGYLAGTVTVGTPPVAVPVVFTLSPVAGPTSVHLTGSITSGSSIVNIGG